MPRFESLKWSSWQVEIHSGTFSGSSGRLSGKGFATWNACSWNVIAMPMEGTREETHNNGLLQVYLNIPGHQYMSTGNSYKCKWSRRTPVILHPILHQDASPQRVVSVVSPSNPHPVQQSAPTPPPSTDTNHHRHHHVFSPPPTPGADQHSNRAIHSHPATTTAAASSSEEYTRETETRDGHRTPHDRRHQSRKSHAISHWST